MQTNLADFIKNTADGQEADAILRSCVHCGFCTATCPTYQLLGDELDGPRGRIYLIKQVLEGKPATRATQLHLDRCLTCRNCETTCPSGVRYGRLVDIGRRVVDEQLAHRSSRPLAEKLMRTALKETLTRKWLFSPLMKTGQLMRPMLPNSLKNKVPAPQSAGVTPTRTHSRRMLLLDGCVQPSMAPNINSATARVLDALAVQLVVAPKEKCCGAIRHHMNDHRGALDEVRRNIDSWWPYVVGQNGSAVEAIVITASGCGVMIKDYGHLLRNDPLYADKAKRISALTRDLSEVLAQFVDQLQGAVNQRLSGKRVAYHPPCTLQHGQQIRGKIETMLAAAGAEVHLCADSHLCCGSAGTYSVLQPNIAYQLRDEKLGKLEALNPDVIVSANIGCLTHLQSGSQTPVKHWIELLDEALSSASRSSV